MNKEHFDFEAKRYIKNPESEWVYAEDAVPAIVDEELWNKANEKLNKRKNVDRTTGVNTGRYQGCNVLSSKIICGICGSLYWRNKRSTAVYWYCSEGSRSGRVRENTGSKCVSLNLKEDELLDVINRIGDCLWNEEEQKAVINKVLHKIVDILRSDNSKKILILMLRYKQWNREKVNWWICFLMVRLRKKYISPNWMKSYPN